MSRGCDSGSAYGSDESDCMSAEFAGNKATMCYCSTDKCNTAAAMTSSLGHVIVAVALCVSVIVAHRRSLL